jgi:type VI secretion system secreted protein Hcp
MPADNFLKLGECPGESEDAKHKGEIELLSVSLGAVQPGSSSIGSGQGTTKVDFQDVSCMSYVGKHTPKLLLHCANGKPIGDGVLTVRKAGGDQLEYMVFEMKNVLVSSWTVSQGGDGLATESFSLNFDKVHLTVKTQDEKGGMKGQVKAGWDLKGNQEFGG